MTPLEKVQSMTRQARGHKSNRANFMPKLINIRSSQSGQIMTTTANLLVAPGVTFALRSLVNLRDIEKAIRQGHITGDVGGIFGDIWKGIKKVGKAIGIKKIIKVAKGILKNPIVQAAFPEARFGAAGLETADMLATAAAAKKANHPAATRMLAVAAVTAQRAGLDRPPAAQQVSRQAARFYKIMVTPA
jgi:hypothetical protein